MIRSVLDYLAGRRKRVPAQASTIADLERRAQTVMETREDRVVEEYRKAAEQVRRG